MTLQARLHAHRGRFRLDAAFEVPAGETVALAGPSGAGKTTAVRLLAGVDRLARGQIVFGGDVLDDPDEGVHVPPGARGIGWLPQGGALFPHLDAAGNVAFGLRQRGISRREARRQAEVWLDRVGLADRRDAGVAGLSGGEARRVALARALAVRPRVLLLDEPFTGLDAGAKTLLRGVVRDALADGGGARILVVHDPLDALALADRVVVLEDGSVVQQGTPAELCERPRTPYVAELAGWNVLAGAATVEGGHPVVRYEGGALQVAEAASGAVLVVWRPSAVAVFRERPSGSPRNVVEGRVAELAPTGERVRVRLEGALPMVAELTADAARSLELAPGEQVWAAVKATEVTVINV